MGLFIEKSPERFGELVHLRLVRPELPVQLADGFLDGGNLFVPEMRLKSCSDFHSSLYHFTRCEISNKNMQTKIWFVYG